MVGRGLLRPHAVLRHVGDVSDVLLVRLRAVGVTPVESKLFNVSSRLTKAQTERLDRHTQSIKSDAERHHEVRVGTGTYPTKYELV